MTNFNKITSIVAAWNLKGFGGIPAQRVKKLVEGILYLDAEVLALVEVNPISILDDMVKTLKKEGLEYRSIYSSQQHPLNIAVLYKNGVEVRDHQLIECSDLGKPDLMRRAFSLHVTIDQFDFQLIVVHLKSGRNKDEQEIRDQQARVISSHIKDIRKNSPQEGVILVGDFNMIPGQDVSNFHHLGGDDEMDFISSWDLQESFSHILKNGRANLLDGFAISRTYSKEYIRGSLRVFPLHWAMNMGLESFRKTVSDHLPFVASFWNNGDRGGLNSA